MHRVLRKRGRTRAGETQEGARRRAGETQEGGCRRAGETQEAGAGGQVKLGLVWTYLELRPSLDLPRIEAQLEAVGGFSRAGWGFT